MWIERIELTGFSSAPSEKVEFVRGSLNLFEDISDKAKLLVPVAALAALYGTEAKSDLPIEAMLDIRQYNVRSEKGGPFVVGLELSLGERALYVVRNLTEGRLSVFDRSNGGKEVSQDFSEIDGMPLGRRLTGLERKAFIEEAFLLAPVSSGAKQNSAAQTLSIVTGEDSSSFKEASAINAIDECLTNFPFKEINIKIDFLMNELEVQKDDLANKIENYAERRNGLVPLIERLKELEGVLIQEEKQLGFQEYFKLTLRAAEIDATVMQLRAQQIRINAIKNELTRIGEMDTFTVESQKQIEELWLRRSSRTADYKSIEADLMPKIERFDGLEGEIRGRWGDLFGMTQEQAQSMRAMALNLQTVQRELEEFQHKLRREEKAARDANVDLVRFERTRRTMLALDPKDANDARSYAALLTGFRNQVTEAERGKWKSEMLIKEIDEQRQSKPESGGAVFKLFKQPVVRQREYEGAQADLERHNQKLTEMKAKVAGLEQRLEALAVKANVPNGDMLMQQIQDYGSSSSQLKELDMLQQLIEAREASVSQLRNDLEPYFRQANRLSQQINGENSVKLADDLNACLAEVASIDSSYEEIRSGKEQLEFLVSELSNIDEILSQLFANAGLLDPNNVEVSYNEFYSKMGAFHHYRALQDELDKMEQRYAFATGNEDLQVVISRLEREKRDAWSRIQYLVDTYPEIAEQAPPSQEELENLKTIKVTPEIELLRNERDRLRAEIREFFNDYDDNFASLVERYDELEREITRAKSNKDALELARDRLQAMLLEDFEAAANISVKPGQSPDDLLPLLLDVACLTQKEVELDTSLQFLAAVLSGKRQIILLSNSQKQNLSRFIQATSSRQQPLKFCLRTPVSSDGHLQRA